MELALVCVTKRSSKTRVLHWAEHGGPHLAESLQVPLAKEWGISPSKLTFLFPHLPHPQVIVNNSAHRQLLVTRAKWWCRSQRESWAVNQPTAAKGLASGFVLVSYSVGLACLMCDSGFRGPTWLAPCVS